MHQYETPSTADLAEMSVSSWSICYSFSTSFGRRQ